MCVRLLPNLPINTECSTSKLTKEIRHNRQLSLIHKQEGIVGGGGGHRGPVRGADNSDSLSLRFTSLGCLWGPLSDWGRRCETGLEERMPRSKSLVLSQADRRMKKDGTQTREDNWHHSHLKTLCDFSQVDINFEELWKMKRQECLKCFWMNVFTS